jgi:hypothetical protein
VRANIHSQRSVTELFEPVAGDCTLDSKMYGFVDASLKAVPIYSGPSTLAKLTGAWH